MNCGFGFDDNEDWDAFIGKMALEKQEIHLK
jgi:hypothetical protein